MELFKWYSYENNDHPVMPIYTINGRYACIQLVHLVKDRVRMVGTSMESDVITKVTLSKENKRESIVCVLSDTVYLTRD